MESIKKLRSIAEKGYKRPGYTWIPSKFDSELLESVADEIEHEITELQESWAQESREHAADSAKLAEFAHDNAELKREIAELQPLDADGVPWLLSDEKFIDTTGEVCEINALSFSKYHVPGHDSKWEIIGNNNYVYAADECRHVKPDPVKELLKEFAENGIRIGASEPIPANLHTYPDEVVIDEFVERIRQAVES